MTKQDVFNHWVDTWRSLAAWGAPIPMQVTTKPNGKQRYLGLAWPWQGKCEVCITGDLARDLATALHELAHLAAPNSEHHGKRWRQMFVRGAAEALGCDADSFEIDVAITALDQQVVDAVRAWLVRSGQVVVLRAIGVAV